MSRPAAYSQGVLLRSNFVKPTQSLSFSSSATSFSNERVLVASAMMYLLSSQYGWCSVLSIASYWYLRSIKDMKVLRTPRRNAANCAKAVRARSGDEVGPEEADSGLLACMRSCKG